MKTNFARLMEYINAIQSRYLKAISAFTVYKTINEMTTIEISGQEEANKNAEILTKYGNFFVIAKESLRTYFLLELAKMFDSSDDALHIDKLINITSSQMKTLDIEAYKKYNSSIKHFDWWLENYQGISNEDIKSIKSKLEPNRSAIEKLKIYRDSWLAHDDLKKPVTPVINDYEVREMFKVLEEITNILGKRLNGETWMWDYTVKESKLHTERVVGHLKRFEPYFRKEIDDRLQKEFEEISKINNKTG